MLPPMPIQDQDDCAFCEAAIVDLGDRTLPPEREAALRRHTASCASCATLLADAERGYAWTRILHDDPPVPPPALLAKVLAGTPAPLRALEEAAAVPHPAVWGRENPLWEYPLREYHARALMTAAMAVFSLALTFSVSGLRLGDLAPSRVEAAASRSFYGAKKQVVSFYDNIRILRELESSVEALRKPAASGEKPQPSALREAAPPLLAGSFHASGERNLL